MDTLDELFTLDFLFINSMYIGVGASPSGPVMVGAGLAGQVWQDHF